MDTLKKLLLLLVAAISFSSCVVHGYYSPAPYSYRVRAARYHGWGYYHHPAYHSYHSGPGRATGRAVHQHYGPR